MDKIVFSEYECRESKKKLKTFRKAMSVWGKRYSPSRAIGRCVKLCEDLNPCSYEDFYNKYVDYAERHKDLPVKERGLTESEIIELAKEYKYKSELGTNVDIPLVDYVNDALCHIIVETYDGIKRERSLKDIVDKNIYHIEKTPYNIDSQYGIDVYVKSNSTDEIVFGIQVKPITFLLGPRKDTADDRKLCVEKHYKALSELNIKTYYAVYEAMDNGESVWIESKNGHYAWTLQQLQEKYNCFEKI